jgi:hypothetical protein
MKKTAVIIVLAVVPLLGCSAAVPAASDSSMLGRSAAVPTAVPAATAPAVLAATRHCHSSHGLPDRRCTPGAAYAKVTQKNIGRTICTSGWTATVRPPESYTERLKREQIAQYGYRDKSLGDYEEDHLIPLELGGSPRSVRNLWPEYDAGRIPNPKDKVENALRTAVCDGHARLLPAQRAIARDWKTAEHVLGLTGPAPSPSRSPSPKPTKAAVSCTASVSNSHPADYSTVDVYVRTAAGAAVTTVAQYRTTSHQKSATADAQGQATIAYDISDATKGYQVVVDVTAALDGAAARCSTSFTPA